MVDRIVFGCVAVALMGLGACMIAWPAWIALKNRDDDDHRPVTPGEVRMMRVVGVALLLGCADGLYAILTGIRGDGLAAP